LFISSDISVREVAYASFFGRLIRAQEVWSDGVQSLLRLESGIVLLKETNKLVEVK
jgi:hypothetical protein